MSAGELKPVAPIFDDVPPITVTCCPILFAYLMLPLSTSRVLIPDSNTVPLTAAVETGVLRVKLCLRPLDVFTFAFDPAEP